MNPPNRSRTRALAARLARFDRLVEVAIGRRTDIAARLAEDTTITATDIHSRTVPADVAFVRDDITDPAIETYADADAIYALNLPRELHRPTRAVAREAGATFLFTTLGGEFPAIPTDSETLLDETLFRATRGRPGERKRGERA